MYVECQAFLDEFEERTVWPEEALVQLARYWSSDSSCSNDKENW